MKKVVLFRAIKATLMMLSCLFVFTPKPTYSQSSEVFIVSTDTNHAMKLYRKASEAIDHGKFDSTEFWLDEALGIFKTSNNWEYKVKTYHLLCGVNYRTRRADMAGLYLDSALSILITKVDTSHFLYAPYYHSRGTIFYITGDYQKARNSYFKAIDIYSRFPEAVGRKIVNSYNNLGLTFTQLNDYENAVVYLQKCLDYNLQHNAGNKYLIGRSHNNLGLAYYQKGGSESVKTDHDYFGKESFKKAEKHYLAALANYKNVLKSPNIALGQCFLNLATTATAWQDYDQAIVYNKQALLNFGENTDDPFPEIAEIYYNTGITFKIIGQLDSSRFYLNKAIAKGKIFFGVKHPYLADYYNYLGRVCIEDKKMDEALANFQQSIIISCIDFNDTLYTNNPDIPQVFLKNEAMKDFAWKAVALLEKYKASNDYRYLVLALDNYYLFSDLVNVILSEFTNEGAKLDFIQGVHENYSDIIDICFQLYTLTSNPKYIEDAVYFSENVKASTLLAHIDNTQAKVFAGIDDEALLAETLAQEKLFELENEYMNMRVNKVSDPEKISAVSDSLLNARYQCEKIAMALEEKYEKHLALNYGRKKLKLQHIQSLLAQRNTTAVEYFLTDTTLFIIAINAHDHIFSKVDIDSTFFELIADYRKSTGDYNFITDNPKVAYSTFTKSSWALYNKFFPQDIKGVIQQYPKIFLIPDGILNYISFDGLLTAPSEGRNYSACNYLTHDYILSYANALRFIDQESENTYASQNYAGYAPKYDTSSIVSNLTGEELALFRSTPGLLTEHKAEVTYAGDMLGGDAYVGAEANESNFKRTAGNYNILHLAMHALLDDKNPLSSKFIFTQQHTGEEDDFLNTHEIYTLDLNAQLVVLSACNTANGIIKKGEGVMSLSRAFMFSGVSSVVSSLWLAEDRVAKQMMASFFVGIKDGKPIDEALHNSRIKYLQSSDAVYSHPYYWANFILIGNNTPVHHVSFFAYKTAVFAGVVLLVVLMAFYFVYRKSARR